MDENSKIHWFFGFLDRGYTELNPINCGYEACTGGHLGFGLRSYYMIHYIESGTGTLYTKNGEYRLNRGQCFIVKPDENVKYVADEIDPWTYVWIGFTGVLAKKLDTLPSPVAEIPYTAFSMIRALEDRSDTCEEMASAALFMIYADLMSGKPAHPHYVRRTVDTIISLYMTNLSVNNLADQLGLDRRYLSRIFKAYTGMGIQEYIIKVRMQEAEKLLRASYAVALTAGLVGYQDSFNFSKMFKKYYGISPRKYAQEQKKLTEEAAALEKQKKNEGDSNV